jgi:hypothetical protein
MAVTGKSGHLLPHGIKTLERKLYLYGRIKNRDMVTVDLKKSIHDYIDNADERLLKLIKALVETYQEGEIGDDLAEEQRKILDQRLAEHRADPDAGKDWTGIRSELRTKYGA